MAETLLRTEIKKRKIKFIDVDSAGIRARETDPVSNNAQAVLSENDLTLKRLYAKKLDKKLFQKAFVVITMTTAQKEALPQDKKVFSMAELTGKEIVDPYGKGLEEYRKTFLELKNAVEVIADGILA